MDRTDGQTNRRDAKVSFFSWFGVEKSTATTKEARPRRACARACVVVVAVSTGGGLFAIFLITPEYVFSFPSSSCLRLYLIYACWTAGQTVVPAGERPCRSFFAG